MIIGEVNKHDIITVQYKDGYVSVIENKRNKHVMLAPENVHRIWVNAKLVIDLSSKGYLE